MYVYAEREIALQRWPALPVWSVETILDRLQKSELFYELFFIILMYKISIVYNLYRYNC